MSKRFLIGLAVVLGLGLSSSAQATLSVFTGTLQVTLEGTSSDLMAFGGTADVSLATGSVSLPAISAWDMFAGPAPSHPLFDFVTASVSMDAATGSFTPSGGPGGAFGGNLPVEIWYIWARRNGGPSTYWSVSLSNILSIGSPGDTGQGASLSRVAGVSTVVPLTAVASGWTTNLMSFPIGGPTSPRVYAATGSDVRTGNRGGQITLITPIRVWSGIPGQGVGGFATMTLDFAPVPEPGTALLLSSGLLALAAVGRRQR